MDKLTERQQKILELVVKEYVNTSNPVSSKNLARKLGLSSATLRNEMMELDRTGYLIQPYTSAGRIPTEKGYRLFIKSIGSETGDTNEFEEGFNYLYKQIGEEETKVFIGKEIPIIRTKKYSMIITGFKAPNKKKEVIGLLGPTKMRYDYNIELINKLKELMEGYE